MSVDCGKDFWLRNLSLVKHMKELRNVTNVDLNLHNESIWNITLKEPFRNYISLYSMWESFYREVSFEHTHSVCILNISVPLQTMYIQLEHSGRLRQAYFMDFWRQGASMWVVSWHSYLKSCYGKAHLNYIWHW